VLAWCTIACSGVSGVEGVRAVVTWPGHARCLRKPVRMSDLLPPSGLCIVPCCALRRTQAHRGSCRAAFRIVPSLCACIA